MTPETTALVGTAAPLGAFILALVVVPRRRAVAAGLTIAATTVSLCCSLMLLHQGPIGATPGARWFESAGLDLVFGFLLDGPNLLMGVVVATIALAVQVYSLGYMAGDRGWSRYFALHGLFAWSMLSFVYASSLLQMFIFWELVGLASFLLIGFWYEKPAAAAAARKAFVMTRIGDVGLFIGLILLLQSVGTLDVAQINDPGRLAELPAARLTLIALLFFAGVVGKSAQFPLHTWLPDAMEGPTPVSALLHSATMVAAGVFLFARFHPLFMAAHNVSPLVLTVVLFTAILSATIAMVQLDIKRVLAYSSISQLSFMLIGLAAGGLHAGMFHLTTHALFKALLFLCAGAYIHQLGSNDLIALGRAGARAMRGATVGLVIGAAALAGLPPLAGFFSKESILAALDRTGSPLMIAAAYLASFLTAYYAFRMVFLLVRPNAHSRVQAVEPAGAHPVHDCGPGGHAAMLMPIVLLTLGTVVVGFAGDQMAALIGAPALHPKLEGMVPAVAVALAGVLVAWIDFGRRRASQLGFIARVRPLSQLFERKWYVDDVYGAVVGKAMASLSRACALGETKGLDRLADDVATATLVGGQAARHAQAGRLQLYIATSVLFLAVACYLLG